MIIKLDNFHWREVPNEFWEQWNNILKLSKSNKDNLDISFSCPVCQTKNLHKWYLAGIPINKIFDGVKYIARGNLWVWCSNCGCCQHYSASVPEWWKNDLEVDLSKLTVSPEAIEEARLKKIAELS